MDAEIRHCTACKHFEYSQAAVGYYLGEGQDCGFTCGQRVWEIDTEDDTQETLFTKLNSAAACSHFELADYAKREARRERD